MSPLSRQVLIGAVIGTSISVGLGVVAHVVIRRKVKKVVAVKKADAVRAAEESPFCEAL